MLRFIGILMLVLIVAIASIMGGIYLYLSPDEEIPRIQSPSSVRMTNLGEVVGFQGLNDAHTWLGIPYAQPPVDELRWKAPRPVLPWTQRLAALDYGAPCPQLAVLSGSPQVSGVTGQEDCLTLNVWAPTFGPTTVPRQGERLPVMVWLHGGGNTLGSGGSAQFAPYDGSLMATEHNVIVVTINHRLGPMGWLSLDALVGTSDNPEDASGNFGTLDLVESLRWVQANIAAFGGDPDNVTIYGESAGGQNVLSLMFAPLARGLFHRAISQSGRLSVIPIDEARQYDGPQDLPSGRRWDSSTMQSQWLIQSGQATDLADAKQKASAMSDEEMASWLRGLSTPEIFGVFDAAFAGMINMPAILADGYVMPAKSASELLSDSASFADVPLMIGSNRDETALFMAYSPEYVDFTMGLPSNIRNPTAYRRDVKYSSDLWKADGVDAIAESLSRRSPDQVFVYRFDADDWRNYGVIDLKELFGAAHALEIPFVFGYFPNPAKVLFPDSTFEEVELLSNAMMSYWAEFARHGDPGSGSSDELPAWQPWAAQAERAFVVLDTDIDQGIRMEQGMLTNASVKAAFANDDSFESDASRCLSYRNVFWPPDFDEAEYEAMGCN